MADIKTRDAVKGTIKTLDIRADEIRLRQDKGKSGRRLFF